MTAFQKQLDHIIKFLLKLEIFMCINMMYDPLNSYIL